MLRKVNELRQDRDLWDVDTSGNIEDWIAESYELAKLFVYSPEILNAVSQPGELQPIVLTESYLQVAGQHAKAQIVAAGLRLGLILGAAN